MKLSSLSIKRPVTTAMFFIAVALLGIYAFLQLGVDLLPNVNLPHLVVQTAYQNATPEEIEKLVTEPLESAAGTVPGVKHVTSLSKEGISVISIEFVWGTDMNFAVLTLREKLDNMSFALPRDTDRPVIIRMDPSSSPIMSLVLSYKNKSAESKIEFADHSSNESDIKNLIDLKEAARVVFKRRLEQLDGVAQAVITGGLEREVLIEIDQQKLNAYNISYNDIASSLKSSNVNLSAGSIMKGLFRYSLRALGEYRTTEEIANTVIKKNTDKSLILLRDIAAVKENYKERSGLTRLNGNETVGILIYKEPESNTVTIAQRVREVVAIMEKEYPDFNLLIVTDQSGFISDAIMNVKQEIIYGGLLAVFVLFFFLGSIRHIFIIGITIPSSLVLTILLMYIFNINFNIISLGGIALGIGMLLDNAIIVIENVVRYREKGLSHRDSSLHGSYEVSMPIVAATLTTIVVFLPLVFIKGLAGELFKDQSYAVIFSLSSSILTAITLIPMLSSRDKFDLIRDKEKYLSSHIQFESVKDLSFLKKIFYWLRFPLVFVIKIMFYTIVRISIHTGGYIKRKLEGFFKYSERFLDYTIDKYERLLGWALDNKIKVILLTAVLFVITALIIIDIKKEFIPESPRNEFILEIVYPAGTSLRGNSLLTSNIESHITRIPWVTHLVANIGRVNEFDFLNKEQVSINKSNLVVKLSGYEYYYDVQDKVRNILQNIKGIEYSFKDVKSSYSQIINPDENDISIKIKGSDIDKIFKRSEELLEKISNAKIDGIKDLRLGVEKGSPEYVITINRNKCNQYGLDNTQVGNRIENIVKGNSATSFSDFDKKISITLKSPQYSITNIDDILSDYVTDMDKKVQLKNLIDYELTDSYNEIWREDQTRTVNIYAGLSGSSIDRVIPAIEKVIDGLPARPEQIVSIGGTNDEITSSFSELYYALIVSVLLMYMILASEFESFLFPFIILFSVPLGLIGGIIFLYIFGESISIISLMGLIILVGIADNDAVVKVEFILRKRNEGLNTREAIIQAGKDRFRPIVMNSFTVIFGLIPMMIGIGAGTQLRISLSLAIAGGLISSTFLTLIFIPVLYIILEKWSRKKFSEFDFK